MAIPTPDGRVSIDAPKPTDVSAIINGLGLTGAGDGSADAWSAWSKMAYTGPAVTVIPGVKNDVKVTRKRMTPGSQDVSFTPGTVTNDSSIKASTPDEAYALWYQMGDKERSQLQQAMWAMGLTKGPEDVDGAFATWQKAVDTAFRFNMNGNNKSVMDVLPMLSNFGLAGGAKGPQTRTQTTFNVLDPAQARAALTGAFQQMMGRNPTEAEINSWIASASAGLKAHPQVTQNTVDANGNQTSQVIDPGYDANAALQNQLNNDPEAKAHQAAATLYPALFQALQSPV